MSRKIIIEEYVDNNGEPNTDIHIDGFNTAETIGLLEFFRSVIVSDFVNQTLSARSIRLNKENKQ